MRRRLRCRVVKSTKDSGFSRILDTLVDCTPGCRAVAFVDPEGEAVDIAGYGDEFDIKVAGAHANVLLDRARRLGKVSRYAVRASRTSYLAVALPEDYALVFVLSPRAVFHVSERALSYAFSELGIEAGFSPVTRPKHRWFPVRVAPRGAKNVRPREIQPFGTDEWHPVEVLGGLTGLEPSERGYRIRTWRGVEAMLVREPLGRWWCDEPIEQSEGRPKYLPRYLDAL